MSFFYGADADFDAASEALPGTRDIRTLEVGGRLARAFRDGGLDTQVGTKRAGFKTGDIPMPASDRFPLIKDIIPLKTRSGTGAATGDKKLSERLKAITGFALTDAAGTTYTVTTVMGAVAIKRTAKDGAVLGTLLPGAPEYARTALMLLNASKSRSIFKGKPKGMFKPSASSGSSSGGGAGTGDQSGQTGDQTGSQTPAWASQPYLAQVAALSGFTGPSATTAGVTYTVKMIDLAGLQAPAIDVATGGGATGGTGSTDTITPESATWVAAALEVLAAKSNVDAGIAAPGSTTPGTLTVTSEQTGAGGSVWSNEGLPSSDVLADQAQQTVDAALAEGGAGGGAMTVSGGDAAASGESMLGKYKWLIVGGVGIAVIWYGNKQGWFK
jgi:hypothetical protein